MEPDILEIAEAYEKEIGKRKEDWDGVDINGFCTYLATARKWEINSMSKLRTPADNKQS